LAAHVPTPDGLTPPAAPARGRRRLAWLLVLPLLAGLGLAAAWLWRWNQTRQEWRQAEAALARHDLASAASALDRYLQREPGDAAAWFLAARTARRLGRVADAERGLERCQQVGGVTDATRLEWDLLRVQQGDLDGTDTRLRMTVRPDHPDAPLVLEALARGYVKGERLADARQACDLCLERRPEQPWPWLWRGRIHDRLGRMDDAAEDYTRAVELAPDDREARLALGDLLLRRVRTGEAMEHFARVAARFPDDEEAQLGLAACRIDRGEAAQAVPLLDRVLAANSSSPRGLFLRGKAAFQLDEPAAAEPRLREAVGAAPHDAEALYLLIRCLRAQGKDGEADALSKRLDGLRDDLHRLNELTRATARDPDNAGLRHEAGVLALRIGGPGEGLRWLQSALRAKGDHRPTHAVLAEYYRREGDEVLAEIHRRQAEIP
jgi:tetratricopeptide (TPR) repeat protein